MALVEFPLIGAILIGGFAWQAYVCEHDDEPPKRLYVPFGLGIAAFAFLVLALVGSLGHSAICFFTEGDHRIEVKLAVLGIGLKLGLVCVFLIFKSFFGPIITAIVVATEVYFLFEYGQLRSLAWLEAIVEWLFSYAPKGIGYAYLAISLGYAAISSVWESAVSLSDSGHI